MGTPLRVSIAHQLGRAEARRRIDAGFAKLAQQLPGGASIGNARWHDDRLTFGMAALGQAVSGSVEVLDTAVLIDIELPGLLGQLAAVFKDRLREAGQKLLGKDSSHRRARPGQGERRRSSTGCMPRRHQVSVGMTGLDPDLRFDKQKAAVDRLTGGLGRNRRIDGRGRRASIRAAAEGPLIADVSPALHGRALGQSIKHTRIAWSGHAGNEGRPAWLCFEHAPTSLDDPGHRHARPRPA